MAHKAEALGYHARVINSGRYVNDSMGFYVAKNCVKKIIAAGKNISKSKVLIMGATFKEDVSDIRNSKVADIVKELKSFGVKVEIVDPALAVPVMFLVLVVNAVGVEITGAMSGVLLAI